MVKENKKNFKSRNGKKEKNKEKKKILSDQEGEDFNVEEELQDQSHPHNHIVEKYQSPEQIKRRLAKEVLSQIEQNKPQQLRDDFFVIDREETKKDEGYNEEVSQKLRQQYLRKQNKLYESAEQIVENSIFKEPIQYKGHTLCITAFQVTPYFIFSCSKDRSIIKWDRETQKKTFISLGKDLTHHVRDILCLSLHSNENVIATAGQDCQVKLWDTRSCGLIDTLRGHKNNINGIKFGQNSNSLCSVSSDLTLKQWDFSQRGLIETFYEHNGQILDIDCFNATDFITSGNDHQVISWKTQKQTKVIFKGHDYAIDRVRTINLERFITACQDGSINLWHTKKSKPVFKFPEAHKSGWISALDNLKQTNVFATGAIDKMVRIWSIEGEAKGIKLLKQIEVNGIITDLKLKSEYLAIAECDQLRLGRWVTTKCRNKIKIFPITTK